MRKNLLIVPALVLLAAGCNNTVSGTGDQTSGQNSGYNQSASPSTTGTPSAPTAPATSTNDTMMKGQNDSSNSVMMDSSMWQATLQASNNSAKGNYMLTKDGHIIYLKTSQDYSSLVGQQVMVHYSGNMDSFKVTGITAQSEMMVK